LYKPPLIDKLNMDQSNSFKNCFTIIDYSTWTNWCTVFLISNPLPEFYLTILPHLYPGYLIMKTRHYAKSWDNVDSCHNYPQQTKAIEEQKSWT
jgi:hypothetical protein